VIRATCCRIPCCMVPNTRTKSSRLITGVIVSVLLAPVSKPEGSGRSNTSSSLIVPGTESAPTVQGVLKHACLTNLPQLLFSEACFMVNRICTCTCPVSESQELLRPLSSSKQWLQRSTHFLTATLSLHNNTDSYPRCFTLACLTIHLSCSKRCPQSRRRALLNFSMRLWIFPLSLLAFTLPFFALL
jgi:hypothetical protein